jgi:hypothetical protein
LAVGAPATLLDRRLQPRKDDPQVYAVIRTGGKQYKVKVGDLIDVEKLGGDDTLFAKVDGHVVYHMVRGRKLASIDPGA